MIGGRGGFWVFKMFDNNREEFDGENSTVQGGFHERTKRLFPFLAVRQWPFFSTQGEFLRSARVVEADMVVRQFMHQGDQESVRVEVAVHSDPRSTVPVCCPKIARFGGAVVYDLDADGVGSNLFNHLVNGSCRKPGPQDLTDFFCNAGRGWLCGGRFGGKERELHERDSLDKHDKDNDIHHFGQSHPRELPPRRAG